jgi:hypothetical protein
MEIEDKIRTQIEAILINDARNFKEIKKMATADEPLEAEVLAEERNLYQRIINSYRNAVGEVNKLLEENIASLSSFYRIVDSIKEKKDFQEICSRIVDCILQDFNADYCSLLFPEDDDTLCLEGICEDRRFLRIHTAENLLGSREFEMELTRMSEDHGDCLYIEDVYKEPRFNTFDFPGVVRSVLCHPITLSDRPAGFLLLSHSLPKFFHENHIRVIRILGNYIAHLRLLHYSGTLPDLSGLENPPEDPMDSEESDIPDTSAIVLVSFDSQDSYGRRVPLGKESIRDIRTRIRSVLDGKESVLFYRDRELIVFMPGVTSELLPGRVRCVREAFVNWQAKRMNERKDIRMNVGFSVCEGDEDLSRMLEIASVVMHPESDEESGFDPDDEK